jgi:hypothetical protein
MARRSGLTEKRCNICLSVNGPWTAEDIYPKWLRKWMLGLMELVNETPSDLPPFQPSRRPLFKPVCQSCQRRLNQTFEIPASSLMLELLEHTEMVLTPERQTTIAAWLIKTDIIFALYREPPFALTPPYAELLRRKLLRMMEDGMPPPNTTARIGAIKDGDVPAERPRPFLPEGWPNASISIVSSVSPVATMVSETIIGGDLSLVPYVSATQGDERLLYVWPPQIGGVRWPPTERMGFDDVLDLREEWLQHPDNIIGGFFEPKRLGEAGSSALESNARSPS